MDDLTTTAAGAGSSGVFLIPSPSDRLVYTCFRSAARTWQHALTGERLWIERDIPLTAGLSSVSPPSPVAKLVHADLNIVARLQLEFGALTVTYIRSGGHGPRMYRKSFFDEVRMEIRGLSTLMRDELEKLGKQILASLQVSAAVTTPDFVQRVGDWVRTIQPGRISMSDADARGASAPAEQGKQPDA